MKTQLGIEDRNTTENGKWNDDVWSGQFNLDLKLKFAGKSGVLIYQRPCVPLCFLPSIE